MNWSMITWARVGEVAELRLPQHQRLGRLCRVAVLEAEARDLAQRRVVQLHRRQRVGQVLDRRRPTGPSWRRAGRGGAGENVPRSASWPVRRIGVPSVSSEANASASACAQSMPPSAPSASRRRSSCLTSFGWTVKPSGHAQQLLVELAQPLGVDGGLRPRARASGRAGTRRCACSTCRRRRRLDPRLQLAGAARVSSSQTSSGLRVDLARASRRRRRSAARP